MNQRKIMSVPLMVVILLCLTGGCQNLRFAPGQVQKQNAYLHHRTVQTAATRAQQENASEPLQQLTQQATRQSESILAYYGLPDEIPPSETVDDILSPDNDQITHTAATEAIQRPNPWDLADHLLELGMAMAGVVGGVYGTRALTALQLARQKSTALREIIEGNELFKNNHPDQVDSFKQSHQKQSTTTRSLVATIK